MDTYFINLKIRVSQAQAVQAQQPIRMEQHATIVMKHVMAAQVQDQVIAQIVPRVTSIIQEHVKDVIQIVELEVLVMELLPRLVHLVGSLTELRCS